MPPAKLAKYSPLQADDSLEDGDSETFLKQPSNGESVFDIAGKPHIQVPWWLTHGAAFCVGILIPAILFARTRPPTFQMCTELLSTYSPANEAVEYQTVIFNGSLVFDSIYRSPPSPEVDAAWEKIANAGLSSIRISAEELAKIGKTERPSIVRFKKEDGGGFSGTIEVFHQLHCVNLLRKGIYRDYYETLDPAFKVGSETIRAHLDHCVDIIRQNLMCAGDTGVVTYDWVEGWEPPLPDLNTVHQCRSFEKLLEWQDEHAVHISRSSVVRLEGQIDRPHQA